MLKTHGLCGTPTYGSWREMVKRCNSSTKPKDVRNYRERGIKICAFIRASPANLVSLIGLRPPALTLHRVENDGHYSCGRCPECLEKGWPFNVAWATVAEQNRHRRNTRSATINGVTKPIVDWADELGVPRKRLIGRWLTGRPLLPLEKRQFTRYPKY